MILPAVILLVFFDDIRLDTVQNRISRTGPLHVVTAGSMRKSVTVSPGSNPPSFPNPSVNRVAQESQPTTSASRLLLPSATLRVGESETFSSCWTLLVYMATNSERSIGLHVPFPFGEEQVFRYRAMEDVLELLIRNPFREFSVRQLRDITDNGSKTTSRAVDLLQQLELARVDESGRSKRVGVNRERVTIPDEPLFALPQDEFREPVRAFAERARK